MPMVFISYSRRDRNEAERLFNELKSIKSIEPWFDKENLLPGMKWRPAIRKAIRDADYFLALVSTRSLAGKGFRHTELFEALEIYKEYPPDKIYLIPARLDECEIPYDALQEINWVDLFPDWNIGFGKLLRSFGESFANAPNSQSSKQKSNYEYRVALVDLDLGLSNLDLIARRLNELQKFFHFTTPKLEPVPENAIVDFDGDRNLAVFEIPAKYIQDSSLPVDFVGCFTRHLLAFREDEGVVYNYLAGTSDVDERFMFISAHGLNKFSRSANCSFDYGLIYLLVAELVDYFTKTDYHKDTRGCVLDFCEDHIDLVVGLTNKRFCDSCLKKLKPDELKSAAETILSSTL